MRTVSLSFVLMLLVGCSSEPEGMLQGKVTLEGEPVPNVAVIFTYPDGKKLDARHTRKDGVFELRMVPAGSVQIHLAPKAGVTPANLKTTSGKKLPEKYLSPKESGLTATITGAKQQLDLPLTK